MLTSCDEILRGRLKLLQPQTGPRVNLDTILLSSWVKFRSGHSRFLEAGCASGAISLLLALRFRNIHVTGIEIQPDLVNLAKTNAENNSLADRVTFIHGDLRDTDILPREYYDVLVVNPPYESPSGGRPSPDFLRHTARHELSCTPDDVAELAARVLKSRGRVFAVFTAKRLDVFTASMRNHSITPKRIRFVHPYAQGEAGIFLIECVKAGGEGISVLPPLYVRGPDGEYTREVLDAYEI